MAPISPPAREYRVSIYSCSVLAMASRKEGRGCRGSDMGIRISFSGVFFVNAALVTLDRIFEGR
jgi:hypothetical protein